MVWMDEWWMACKLEADIGSGGIMTSSIDTFRRKDFAMAEKVQQGIALLLIAGKAHARRYLVASGTPAQVIERVLSAEAGARRMHGHHATIDSSLETKPRES